MPEIEKDLEALKGRVNKLENVAYILGGLASVLGLAGASLFTKLSDAREDAGVLQEKIDVLSREIDEDLGAKVETTIRERFNLVVKELGNPVAVSIAPAKFQVAVGDKTTTGTVTCPIGTLPVGGGFRNDKSAVNLVQIYTEERNLILSLDNNGDKPFFVDAWATCLKSTTDKATTAG
ncbi:MAG: hypothetical protein QOH06_618 [Acidobacteriota bacterium]|nr:hypothetical protein [Acidobacteriota bacterium]